MKSMRKRGGGGGGGRKAELERSDVNIAHRPHRNEREREERRGAFKVHRAGDATGEGRLLRTKEKERRGEERTTQGVWVGYSRISRLDRSVDRSNRPNQLL